VPIPRAGLVLALHDITHLRRVERIRRDFVANISHELRTPITSIKLLAETLQAASGDETALPDFANQIASEVDHLAQLVDELLDLTTIESGEVRLAIQAVDPADVLAALAERIGPVAERRRIAVRILPHDPARGQRARVSRLRSARPGAPQPGAQRGEVQLRRRRGATQLAAERRSGALPRGR